METASGRTAVKCTPLVEHRSPTSLISSVAVDRTGSKLYLGLTDGQLEEHCLLAAGPSFRVNLSARKQVGRKPLLDICLLEAITRMAVLSDGLILLLDLETFDGQKLAAAKGATAMSLKKGSGYPPQFAVAVRTSRRDVRIMVFEVVAGGSAASPSTSTAMCTWHMDIQLSVAIQGMAWVEDKIVFCTSLGYNLVDPKASTATLQLFSLPENAMSKTLVQELPGHRHALLLMDQVGIIVDHKGQPNASALTFPRGPSALATAETFLLAICTEAIYVFDLSSSTLVQILEFSESQRPAPDQQLLASENSTGAHVLVAGVRKVWLYTPVALEDQAKQLLMARNLTAALELAKSSAGKGAPWAQTAFAEAGFMLMHEGQFEEAVDAIACCDTSLLQPMELFPLFPRLMKPWEAVLPAKRYWGLHKPLLPLEQLVAKGSLKSAGAQMAISRAEEAVVRYLLKVREREGLEAIDGMDTLIIYLLSKRKMNTILERFARAPNHAVLELVEAHLTLHSQMHALASLCANSNRATRALAIWKALAEESQESNGACTPQESSNFEASEGDAAVQHAAHLLQNSERVDDDLALQYLPWLLKVSQSRALAVIKARRLNSSDVLALIRCCRSDITWQYLDHLVWECKSQDPEVHTDLALTLIQRMIDLLPPPEGSKQPRKIALAFPSTEDMRLLRSKLCKLLKESELYNRGVIRKRLLETNLYEEQVVIHEKVGDHASALNVLALVLCDIHRAQALCERLKSEEAYLMLLDILLHPPDGQPPLYADACRLMAAQGANLDPMRVIESLSEDMPLAYAADIFARMLREQIHRHRHGVVLRNLHRSLNLFASAERAEVMGKLIVVGEERVCHICHVRLGNRMCAMYPNGILACFKCASKTDSEIFATAPL